MTTPAGALAYVALGTNVGDRLSLIHAALEALDVTEGLTLGAVSRIMETRPEGPVRQTPFLNAVAAVWSDLPARMLLERCLDIERVHGRDRERERRWGPRRLDLDLLLYGDAVIEEPGLVVPHPRLHERRFVLGPLAEIAPSVVHPVLLVTVESLAAGLIRGAGEWGRHVACSS